MMKCDDIALEALVDPENIDADDIDAHNPDVARHVESCTQCQNRLAGLAADAEQWDEIQRQLSSGATDPDAEYLGAHQRWKRPAAWNDAMAKTLLSPASHPEMLGRIGRYDVERLIGSGGMGVVFKAYDTELNRPVAVKLLAPYLSASGAARNRFAREARAAAAVVDDHVVPIHNVETDDEHPFLVMKYIGGGSLQRRLDREGPLEVCEVLRIGMQTAKGLAAAHAQGLIHRDVKPSNILLDEGVDRALLTDFGLARATDDANLTRSGFHPGTPHYMSPEQVRGEAIDDRSDLFGLGCVLYGLCTGHPPFRSETSYAVLRRITDDTPRPIREINPDIPTWLEQVVMKLLEKSADDRYKSADQVADLLEDCLAHVQQPTTTPLPESLRTTSAETFLTKIARRLGFTSTAKRGRSDAVAAGRGSTPSSIGFRYPPIGKIVAAVAFGFFLILAGVTIVLELNKGTLTIESDVVDVPIRIMQGETIYKKLNVSQKANTVRIAAGKYVVEFDGEFTDMSVVDGVVTLQRGESETVRIVKSDGRKAADAAQADLVRPGSEQSKIQIWGPTTLDSHTVASDPPSVDEIMQALEKARPADNGIPMLTEQQRSNVRIIKEKIADFVDPPRFYPNVGRAKVHHVHYKCTIRFDETTKISYPIPHTLKAGDAFEVVYIDHTHFHMVNEPANANSENFDVDFAKLSSLRDRLHEADRVVDQMRDGPFYVPETGSIEDAKQSLGSANEQLQRYILDRQFLHREVISKFVILCKQHDLALSADALAQKEADAYQHLFEMGTIEEIDKSRKRQAAATTELASAELAELVKQFSLLIDEFGIKRTQSPKEGQAGKDTSPEVLRERITDSPSASSPQSPSRSGKEVPAVVTRKTQRQLSAEPEITVEFHCGDDFIFTFLDEDRSKKKMLDRLVLKLRENHGVNYQFRSTGPGDVLSKVVVRDPQRRCDRDAKLHSRIEAAIQSAGLSESTRWENTKAPSAKEDHISVNINCGAEFLMPYSDVKWRSHEAKADIKLNQLFFQLNMIEGIDARFSVTGPDNDVSVVVNDPAQRTKTEPKLKSKLESILKSTGVQIKTKWATAGNENALQDADVASKDTGKSKSPAVAVPPMEFDSLEDFLKPGKDLFEKEMKQIDQRLATAKEGTAEHTLFTTKKKQLQERWDLSVAQVKGMVAAAESGNPVQLAPIVIPGNPTPWKAPLPDPLQTHDEEIAKVLAGTWDIIKPTSFLEDGKKLQIEEFSATFSKNMLITQLKIGEHEGEMQYIYRIAGDKIDLWSYDPEESQADQIHPMLGSFSLKDDTLRISYHEREMEIGQPQPRPPVKPGKGLIYWEMKRRTLEAPPDDSTATPATRNDRPIKEPKEPQR